MPEISFQFDPLPLLGRLDRSKEQVVPGHDSKYWVTFHLAFYRYAMPRARGRVLDIGCGYGYGSALLAGVAARVDGIDFHAPAIASARREYPADNLHFHHHDANTRLPFEDGVFDLVVSSEVLEHIHHQEGLLNEIKRVTRLGGSVILKTPNALNEAKDSNPHHAHTFTLDEFREMVTAVFPNSAVYYWVQRYELQHQMIDLPMQYEVKNFDDPYPSEKALLLYTITTPKVIATDESDGAGCDLLAVCRVG